MLPVKLTTFKFIDSEFSEFNRFTEQLSEAVPQRCSVLRNFAKFTGKHLSEFCEISKNNFF